MIRLLILIAVIFGALYLVRWFLRTPAETVAAQIRKGLWLLLGLGLIFLAVTGRLNIIFAFIGSAVPIIARYLPRALQLLGLYRSIKNSTQQKQSGTEHQPQSKVATMNRQQALDVLGLSANATKQEIIDTHKRLMQKVHPDKGGTEHMAAQLNQAKKVLLKEFE